LKVAEYLVNKQKDFFLNSGYLNIITLKEIANDLNLSISTLSRIVNEKYIDTPKGILPFKFLLGKEGVKKGVFGTKVKMLIKEMVDKEDKKRPYSDSEIEKILIKRESILKEEQLQSIEMNSTFHLKAKEEVNSFKNSSFSVIFKKERRL